MPWSVSGNIRGPSGADGAAGPTFVPIPFYISGSLSVGIKKPEFIAPVALTVTNMQGRCDSGASATYRPTKNGVDDGTTSAATGTTVVSTAQNVTLAAGDRLGLDIVDAGTGVDLSVTFWAQVV